MLAAEVTAAETTVADDALSSILAVLEVAANLLGRAAAKRQGHMDGALAADVVRREVF